MGIGAIGSGTSAVGQTYGVGAVDRANDGDRDDVAAVGQSGVTSQVSSTASLFQQLAALQQTDPEKLKAALATAAKELQTAAQQTSGPESQFLSKLADRFAAAAQTGDLSQLQPQSASSSSGSGQATGVAAYQSASSTDAASALQQAAPAQGAQGHHHHHHGGGGGGAKPGADALQVLAQVFQELQAAVAPGSSASASTGAAASAVGST